MQRNNDLFASEFHNRELSVYKRIMLVYAPGGRFPWARLQSPRHYVPAGLSARAVPTGVAAFRSNQQNKCIRIVKYKNT